MIYIKIILFVLILHLVATLKPNDFCIRKQQECVFYDSKHNYHSKCELIKCNGSFKNDCGFNICSKNKKKCNHYFYVYSKLALAIPTVDAFFALKDFEKQKKFQFFNKQIPDCKNEIYKFESKDFCSNEKGNCFVINNYLNRFALNRKITHKIECKCPSKQSFKCGKYCASNSIACAFIESNKIENKIITDCGNQNITFISRYNYGKYLIQNQIKFLIF
jgi:hypothetical protein